MFAVLTGDLVKSRGLDTDELHAARAALNAAVSDLGRAHWGEQGVEAVGPEFFRGDSWQCVLTAPRWALRSAVYLRTSLLRQGLCDTRIAIGIGSVRDWGPGQVSRSTGTAFELSGQALDALGPRFRMALAVAPGSALYSPWCDVVIHLCDSIIAQWEGRQIETAWLRAFHPDASHAELGRRLDPPVTQQAVSKSLASAGWHGLGEALERFEALGK